MKIAIVGATGKMGQWMSRLLLADGYEIIAIGRNQEKLSYMGKELNVETTTDIAQVRRAEVVLISVPIRGFEEVVASLAPHIIPGQSVMDITSIKVKPVAAMHKYLTQATVLGTHPLFGPGAQGIAGQNFILTPTDEAEERLADKARGYLEAKQARVKIMSPEEHDKLITIVLGLAHYIAIISADTLRRLGRLTEAEEASSTTYKLLLTLVESVIAEDPHLYASIQTELPDLPEVQQGFISCAEEWARIVALGKEEEFAKRMTSVRKEFEAASPGLSAPYSEV